MRPSSRLDAAVVPADQGPVAPLVARWEALGLLGPDGRPGPRASALGAFRRWRVDAPGGLALWANRQGGFSVRCPTTDVPVIEAFVPRWEATRGGPGPLPTLPCPACGAAHPLDGLAFRPPAAFGTSALLLLDLDDGAVHPPDGAAVRVVLRRG